MQDGVASGPAPLAVGDRVTILADTLTATVSSLRSEDSTERLICATPPPAPAPRRPDPESGSARPDPAEAARPRRGLLVGVGAAHVALGVLLLGAGAWAVLRGAALARSGAGLWAGGVAVVTGVVGVLAGIDDCHAAAAHHAHHAPGGGGGGLLRAFLALLLASLACGHGAAVLAAAALHRHLARQPHAQDTFQEEMEAWAPVLAHGTVLVAAVAQCALSALAACHVARRVWPCLRRKRAFDHNQFDPHHKPLAQLQLQPRDDGSGKDKLVSSWLGRQPPTGPAGGVRKTRRPPPLLLLPAHAHAHAHSTLGRVGVGGVGGVPVSVMVAPRYATLPLAPAPVPYRGPRYPRHPALQHHPPPDVRRLVVRSPRGGAPGGSRRRRRARDSQLTRSLERIHRKRRSDARRPHDPSDAELRRTYTGLDRTYAEQFIAVCDESRSQVADRSDSLTSSATTDRDHDHDHDSRFTAP